MNPKNNVKFELHICDHCASERQLKMEIFQLKKGRVRQSQPCLLCKAQTRTTFSGQADSDKEVELIKSKLT